MALTGQQRRQLHDALINGFPKPTSLERMLSYELDKNLKEITSEGDLENIVFEVIRNADCEGWINRLICGACKYNPGNEQLRAVKEELLPILNQETFPVQRIDNPPQKTNQYPVSESNEEEPRIFQQPSKFGNHDQALEAKEYEQNFRQLLRDGHPTGDTLHEELRRSSRLSKGEIKKIERKVNEEYESEEREYGQALSRVIWRFIILDLFVSPRLRSVSPCSKLCDNDLKRIYSRLKRNTLRKARERAISFAKILLLIALIALIAFLVFRGYRFIFPREIETPKQQVKLPSSPEKKVDVSEKISYGKISLFPSNFFNGSMKSQRSPIIDSFKNAKTAEEYKSVVQSFNTYLEATDSKGKKINRNDAEALIFKNNAMALAQGNPLKIGVSVPIGGNDNVAMEMLRGVAQAQKEFNENNTGRLLEVVIGSDQNEGEVARNIAEEFVKPEYNILAVVGHNTDEAFSAAAPVYEQGQMVAITPTSLGTPLQKFSFAYRAIPNVNSITNGFVKNINSLPQSRPITNILICVDQSSPDNVRFSESFNNSLDNKKNNSYTTVCDLSSLKQLDSQAITSLLKNAVKDGADAVLLAPHINYIEQAIAVAKAVAKENKKRESSNQKSLILLGSHTMNTYQTLREGQYAVQGMIIAVPWNPKDGEGKIFRQKANELWKGDINWRTAMTYDVTNAIIDILKKNPNGKVSPKQLLKYSALGATGNISFGTQRNLSVSLLEVQENLNDQETGYKFEPL